MHLIYYSRKDLFGRTKAELPRKVHIHISYLVDYGLHVQRLRAIIEEHGGTSLSLVLWVRYEAWLKTALCRLTFVSFKLSGNSQIKC